MGTDTDSPPSLAALDGLSAVSAFKRRQLISSALEAPAILLSAWDTCQDRFARDLLACPEWIYNTRNVVELLWARLKEWRAVATRYEKTASSFMGILCLAAALDWLKT